MLMQPPVDLVPLHSFYLILLASVKRCTMCYCSPQLILSHYIAFYLTLLASVKRCTMCCCSPQLIDVAAATQTSAALKAVMELLVFDDDYSTQHPERFLLAATYSTHPREFLLKNLLVSLEQRAIVLPWCFVINNTSLSSSRSSQCSTTGVTKAVVCAILSVGWCI